MIARAPGRGWRARPASRFLPRIIIACAGLLATSPAAAELGAQVSVFSDARFRGYSLSGGHPVAIVDLSYDDRRGLYAAASASALASSADGIKPLGLQLSAGYARRLGSGITLDVGAIHSAYTRYSSRDTGNSYTEAYGGLSYKFLSSRIAFSPHYFEHGARTLYGELNANISPASNIHLTGHAGVLMPIGYGGESGNMTTRYDWRVGISRDVGHVSFHLIGSGGGPGRDYYRGHWHNPNALVAGVSWTL